MTTPMLLCFLGYGASFAGLALVYAHWRAATGRRGWLIAGWMLAVAGAACCTSAMSVERGLTHWLIGCAVGGILFTLFDRAQQPVKPVVIAHGRGRTPARTRFDSPAAARLIGGLLIAPAAALACGWAVSGLPGQLANRLVAALLIIILAMTVALVLILAARRPWAANAAIAAAGCVLMLPQVGAMIG